MHLSRLQEEVARWVEATPQGYWPPLANLARLVEEVGELARAVNVRYGPKPLKNGEERPSLDEEMGDVLFTLLVLANQTGVDLERTLAGTLERYDHRTPPGRPS